MTSKAQERKEKNRSTGLSQNYKHSCFREKKKKENIAEKWEKIVTNHISDNGLVVRIYKQFLQLKRTRKIIQFKNENRI